MNYEEVAILLNCQTLEDFPVHHEGEEAESLLASWTALWHPSLIASCGKLPQWYRVDAPPDPAGGCLLVIPLSVAGSIQPRLAEEWASRGVLQISGETCREQILQQALQRLQPPPEVDPNLASDFMALGYAYLQVRLLTRKMRYSATLEESVLEANLVAGARAAVSGDAHAAGQQLQACFDLLAQERNHYYAVDVFLIDLSLLSEQLPPASLRQQLARHPKSNLLLSAECLLQLAQRSPDQRLQLQKAVNSGSATLVGGEYRELPLPLLSTETLRGQLQRGLQVFQQQLQCRPHIFGRRQFGLTPSLPQLLVAFGYRAALHATLDGGQFPEATQSKSRWEGDAQSSLDAIVRSPLDASRPQTFLNLAGHISESMDMDHVATRCFAHWADQQSPWYDELLRISGYTGALGQFVTLDAYFDQTYDPGLHDRFGPDQYHAPYLQQRVAAGDPRPISRYARYWQRWGLIQGLSHCTSLVLLLGDDPAARAAWRESHELSEEFAATALDEDVWEGQDGQLRQRLNEAARQLATRMAGSPQANTPGLAVVNPYAFPRRVTVEDVRLNQPPLDQPPVYAGDPASAQRRLIVDLPTMGVALLAESGARASRRRPTPPLAEERFLRNEFLEVHIDRRTGGLRALRDYGSRGNRMSQQLAYRLDHAADTSTKTDEEAVQRAYTSMIADRCEVTQADALLGEIVTGGHLQDPSGRRLADFQQTFRLQRGSRVLELEIDLQPHVDPQTDPWRSYLACRFAWSSEASDLARSYQETRRPTKARRLEAPLFVQVDDGLQKTAILTGGLPFHRRVGRRMLDTLLIAGGEVQRTFRLGIGVDLKQPFREALGLLLPTLVVHDVPGLSTTRSGWLFHLDARNALLTGCRPLLESERLVGIRLHVVETDGRSSSVCLRSFRSLSSARKVDANGQTVNPCEVVDDQVRFALSAYELADIEARFVE